MNSGCLVTNMLRFCSFFLSSKDVVYPSTVIALYVDGSLAYDGSSDSVTRESLGWVVVIPMTDPWEWYIIVPTNLPIKVQPFMQVNLPFAMDSMGLSRGGWWFNELLLVWTKFLVTADGTVLSSRIRWTWNFCLGVLFTEIRAESNVFGVRWCWTPNQTVKQ